MANAENCAFCDREALKWRIIRAEKLFISFVSRPWFRRGQCLVAPTRHITSLDELSSQEGTAIMIELSRLSIALDEGHGTGIMQKYQPSQAENGIKMNHLHFHVFPRFENEKGLFPVPMPNSFDGFTTPIDQVIVDVTAKLR